MKVRQLPKNQSPRNFYRDLFSLITHNVSYSLLTVITLMKVQQGLELHGFWFLKKTLYLENRAS